MYKECISLCLYLDIDQKIKGPKKGLNFRNLHVHHITKSFKIHILLVFTTIWHYPSQCKP